MALGDMGAEPGTARPESADLVQAQLEKAQAEARSAASAATKAAREEAEAASPAAVARRQQQAELDVSKAARENLVATLPDLSGATRGDLSVTGGGDPTAGTSAAGLAITRAAATVAKKVVEVLGADDWSVLVTTDPDLVADASVLRSTNLALQRLTVLADQAQQAADEAQSNLPGLDAVPLGPILAGAGHLIPGILSLLSPPKSLSTGTVSFDDTTASVAVAGALKGRNDQRHVLHHDFRLLPPAPTKIETALGELARKRDDLAQTRTKLQIDSSGVQPGDSAAVRGIADALALTAQVVDAIDTYTQGLNTVAPGANHSVRTTAIMQEAISDGALNVLLVGAQSASGSQLVTNNFLRSDKFAVVAVATITCGPT